MVKKLRITFLGDLMCKAVMLPAYRDDQGRYDFSSLFQHMESYFAGSDLVVANIETPLSVDNSDLTFEQYGFCAPHEFAEAAARCGINFASTANNHCLDRGIAGIESTVEVLDSIGMPHTGVFAEKGRRVPTVLDVGGFRIGIMSYTYGTNAFSNGCYLSKQNLWRVNMFQGQELSNRLVRFNYRHCNVLPCKVFNKAMRIFSKNARLPVYERREPSRRQMRELVSGIDAMKKSHPDLIVMCMHAGGQYGDKVADRTKRLASFLLDRGIDVVVGNHEHGVHGGVFNREDGRTAAYCLGDFCGITGLHEAPFDKYVGYSIAWNLYIDPEKTGPSSIESMGFSILKTVPLQGSDQGVQVVPLEQLFASESNEQKRAALLDDARVIAERFCGNDIVESTVKPEYLIARAPRGVA